MNSLIKHVSFLFSIFPLSNRVKIFPAVWKWSAGRGRELLTLLGAFSIWRKWPLLTLLATEQITLQTIKETPICSVKKAYLSGILHEKKCIYSSCYTRHHVWEMHLMAGTRHGCSLPINNPNFAADANATVNCTCSPLLLRDIPPHEVFGRDRKQLLFPSLRPALGMISRRLHTCCEPGLLAHLKAALAKKHLHLKEFLIFAF